MKKNLLMKIRSKLSVIITGVVSLLLSSCTATFNPLGDEEYIIFQNESESVRLEIGTSTSNRGRLYVVHEEVHEFTIYYRIVNLWMGVYLEAPIEEPNFFNLSVYFEYVNVFKTNYDVMYLRENLEKYKNPEHDILSGFNEELQRIYDEEMNPFNYYRNTWSQSDFNMVFTNDNLVNYYSHVIGGTINEEKVLFSIVDSETFMIRNYDLRILLAGNYSFKGIDIVLEQFGWFGEYPRIITLEFGKINNA